MIDFREFGLSTSKTANSRFHLFLFSTGIVSKCTPGAKRMLKSPITTPIYRAFFSKMQIFHLYHQNVESDEANYAACVEIAPSNSQQ